MSTSSQRGLPAPQIRCQPNLQQSQVITVAPKPTPAPTKTTSNLDPRFDTCGEANDAGYGPYVSGINPEYDWYQDRDHDDIDCER